MVQHELEAIDAAVDDASPYFFQRIGELSFNSDSCKGTPSCALGSRQRECIATAPHHGLIAIASKRGKDALEIVHILLQTCTATPLLFGIERQAIPCLHPAAVYLATIDSLMAASAKRADEE